MPRPAGPLSGDSRRPAAVSVTHTPVDAAALASLYGKRAEDGGADHQAGHVSGRRNKVGPAADARLRANLVSASVELAAIADDPFADTRPPWGVRIRNGAPSGRPRPSAGSPLQVPDMAAVRDFVRCGPAIAPSLASTPGVSAMPIRGPAPAPASHASASTTALLNTTQRLLAISVISKRQSPAP